MRIYIIAGEPSGDLLAAGLVKALRRAVPEVKFRGVGGEAVTNAIETTDSEAITSITSHAGRGKNSSAAQKFKSLFDISDIAVMGLFEVLPRLPLILKHINQTINDIEAFDPDVIVTVDSWGFVSALVGKLRKKWQSKALKAAKNQADNPPSQQSYPPVVHYVAPQVWAWKKGRAKNVAHLVDRLMTLLPDEGQYFEKYGLKSDFVGHPVVERIASADLDPAEFRAANAIPADATVISLLPGSRHSEVKRMLPVLKQAVTRLAKEHDNLFIVVPTVATVADEVRRSFKNFSVPTLVVTGEANRYNAFATSTLAIAKSGTVSLELAAVGVPHLIAYTFNKPTNMVVKRFIKVRFGNLINLLADREIVPEFVLDNCRAGLIAKGATQLLHSPETADRQIVEARYLMQKLRWPDTLPSERAAQVVLEAAHENKYKHNSL